MKAHPHRWRTSLIIAYLAALSLIPLLVAWQIRSSIAYDDTYITLTYARNLALGRGFVYNGGEPFLGTTTPLLALWLGALGAMLHSQDMVTLALWTGAGAWVGIILASFVLGKWILDDWAGVFMAGIMATMSIFPHVLRAEFPMLIFWSMLGILFAMRQRYWLSGILFALAFLTRGDAALVAGLTGLAVIWKTRKIPWALGWGFIIALIPWFIYAFITFGQPLPATLGVKRAHRALGAWPHLLVGFKHWFQATSPIFRFRFLLSAVIGWSGLIWFGLRRNVWALVVIGWGMVYALAYILLNVPFYFWYVTPVFAAAGLSAGLVLALAGKQWQRAAWAKHHRIGRRVGYLLAIFIWGTLLYTGALGLQSAVEYAGTISPRFQMYLDTAQWLKDHTAEDSTVGYLEVGIIAYYSERQILDLLGLVTPGIESFIAEGDFASLFQHLRPDYYLRNRDIEHWKMNSRVTASPFFQRNYQPVALIPQRGKHPMIIYQRRSPLVPNPTQPLSLLERIAQAPGTHASYGLETDIPGYTSIALPDAIQQAIQGQDVWLVTQPTHVADIVHAVQKANQTDDPSLHILWFNHPDVPQTIFWLTTKPPSERFVILEMYDLLAWADPEQLARWWSAYGRELQENQDFANAAFAYQQALEFNPHDAQLHMSLAVALMGAGRYQKALAEMEQAVQLAPTDAKAYRLLGKTYLSLGQYEKATDAFQHAYALDASEPDLLFLLAWAQWRAGDPQAALQWLDQLDQYDHLPPDLRQRSEQLRKNIEP